MPITFWKQGQRLEGGALNEIRGLCLDYVRSPASTMFRVPCSRRVVRLAPAPMVENMASCPATALSTASGSSTSPRTTFRVGCWRSSVLAGSRAYAVTRWPWSRACFTSSCPVSPVEPKISNFILSSRFLDYRTRRLGGAT